MKLLIDTNIILDVLLNRMPYCQNSVAVLNLTQRSDVQEYISASAVTDIYYIAQRQLKNRLLVKSLLIDLLKVVSVAAVSEQEINRALDMDWSDFEDAVQYSIAFLTKMDGIVTRNSGDYQDAEIPIWEPEQILKILT